MDLGNIDPCIFSQKFRALVEHDAIGSNAILVAERLSSETGIDTLTLRRWLDPKRAQQSRPTDAHLQALCERFNVCRRYFEDDGPEFRPLTAIFPMMGGSPVRLFGSKALHRALYWPHLFFVTLRDTSGSPEYLMGDILVCASFEGELDAGGVYLLSDEQDRFMVRRCLGPGVDGAWVFAGVHTASDPALRVVLPAPRTDDEDGVAFPAIVGNVLALVRPYTVAEDDA